MRVLIIDTNPMICDGIFSAIINYAECIDKNQIYLDFVAINENVDETIVRRIKALNANLYILSDRNHKTLSYIVKLSRLIRKNRYDLVHAHGSSCTLATEMLASALAGTPCCPHSHSTSCLHTRMHRLLRPIFNILYRNGFACGVEAGKWLYGNRKYVVLKNGIDTDKFAFSAADRKFYREKYHINSDEIVLIHIAHFIRVKNHVFLLDFFTDLVKDNPKYKLLLVGKGEEEKEIRKIVNQAGITDKVIFTGITQEIPQLLSASDIMLLPSLYEGFPFVTIEAQASGIKCLVSDMVTDKCKLTDELYFVPLDKKDWISEVKKNSYSYDRGKNSKDARKNIIQAGYDIMQNVEKLEMCYNQFKRKNKKWIVKKI